MRTQKKKNNLKINKSNLIGFAVLGVGVLVLLLVGYSSYQKFNKSNDAISQNDIDDFKRGGDRSSQVPNRAAGEKPKKTYKRQKSISERQIAQTWETHIKAGRALLEIGKGKYRFILIPSAASKTRYYSHGNYTIQDDIIVLQPDLAWGAPDSTTHEYKLLTRSKMPVMAAKYKGKLIWQVPPPEVSIYVPPYHPILNRAKDKIVVWSILE